MVYVKSYDRVSRDLFSTRERESWAGSSLWFRQELNFPRELHF